MGTGWGKRSEPHPLIEGKTPLQLEEMDYEELLAHVERAEAYVRKVKDEALIHTMIRHHNAGRNDLREHAPGATQRYRDLWLIARKRVGLSG